jgi:hypothetical protein
MSTDLFADDLDALGNDGLYAAIAQFADEQPNEGWRHDYTEEWGDDAVTKVAAFANTFGGLLIVGVRKGKADVTPVLIGAQSNFEYKTRIASAIAANISPVPLYNIFECHTPGISNKRFCVVRIRDDKALHLVTKKNLSPVYVRNEDEARPANAEQLRRLIDRERELPLLSESFNRRAHDLQVTKVVKCGYQDTDSENWHMSASQYSLTTLKLEMVPTQAILLELERSHEVKLRDLVAGLYRRVQHTIQDGVANQAEIRAAQSYEYVWYHKNLDYEGRWRITGGGEIGHATQMKYDQPGAGQPCWSMVDIAMYVVLFATLSLKWWESSGYLGEGQFHAQLNVPGLSLLRSKDGYFTGAFDPLHSPGHAIHRPSIRKDAILVSPSPGTGADAMVKVNHFTAKKNLPRLTTSILNQLLRPLGYAVVWDLLQGNIESMIRDQL